MPKPKRNIQAVAEETLHPPDAIPASEKIARVVKAAGNNLYQLELPTGQDLLAELPSRFRSTIWVKRGTYVLVDITALADRENKLGGEIVNIVREEKTWRKMSYWPAEFVRKVTAYGPDSDEDEGPQMPPSDSDQE